MRTRHVLLAALLSSLVFAGCMGAEEEQDQDGFPDNYLLESDEVPDGMRIGEIPEQFEGYVSENPGEVPVGFVEEFFSGVGADVETPSEAWVEFLEKPGPSEETVSAGVLIAAAQWKDSAEAASASDLIDGSPACDNPDAMQFYRDGKVIVLVTGDKPYVGQAGDALAARSPGLAAVC